MKNKVITAFMIAGFIAGNTLAVSASGFTGDGQTGVPVTIPNEVPTAYTVSLSPVLNLTYVSGDDYEGIYEVAVKGTLPKDKAVEVIPDGTFTVSGASATKTGTVTQEKTMWLNKDISASESAYTEAEYDNALGIKEDGFTETHGKARITVPGDGTYTGGITFTYRCSKK